MESSPYRERYELLIERRRALLELEILESRIRDHPLWERAREDAPELEGALETRRSELGCQLCARACQARSDALLCDVRRITAALVELARIWVALEDGRAPRKWLQGGAGSAH